MSRHKSIAPPGYRNKCQYCFSHKGRFIMDCQCIFCEGCMAKKNPNMQICPICQKQTRNRFIDVTNKEGLNKMSYLFSNFEVSMERCMKTYRFQAEVEAKYRTFLQDQLSRYRKAVAEIVTYNPQFAAFFDAKLSRTNVSNQRSVSEQISNHPRVNHQRHPQSNDQMYKSVRSISEPHAELHQKMLDVQPVRMTHYQRNYSGGNAGYQVPRINSSTALRSNKRPSGRFMHQQEEDEPYYMDRVRRRR